ncbi:MAG: DUF72 domain-containing protein [Dokdonella sp.]
MSKSRQSADDLFAAVPVTAARIRVGCGGWTFAPWRDNFYPAKLVQRRELEYASRHVTAIEVNGTYYGAQKPATYAKWRAETPAGFVFSLKAPRYATDRKVLADAGKTVTDFIEGGLAELGDRLGPINWQFPPYKAFDAGDFEAFIALLPHTLDGFPLRHVAEVRHASFACVEYIELARRYRVATVFTDSPKYPSFADLTGDFVYARLMCSDAAVATGYPAAALDTWAARAGAWAAGSMPDDLPYAQSTPAPRQPRDVFVYFINGAKERAPHAAMALIERLDGRA